MPRTRLIAGLVLNTMHTMRSKLAAWVWSVFVDTAFHSLADLADQRHAARRAAVRTTHTTGTGSFLISQCLRHVATWL